jgi:hypothetical protein
MQVPVEVPLLSVMVKGSLILMLYAGFLSAIDKTVRELMTNLWKSVTGWFHPSSRPALESVSAITERT